MPHPWSTSASASLGGDDGVVTLVEGPGFAVSSTSGDMLPGFPHGVFFRDTRFLSELRLSVNGHWPEPLAATTVDPFHASFVLRDQPRPGVADSQLVVFRDRYVGRGMREDIVMRNYGTEAAACELEILIGADFADLFEVKEGRVENTGDVAIRLRPGRLCWEYERGAFRRGVHLDFSEPPRLSTTRAVYDIVVPPDGEWSTCLQLTPVVDDAEIAPTYPCGRPVDRSPASTRLEAWKRNLPTVTTRSDSWSAVIERSTDDLAALRLFDADHPDRTVIAAGAPWFMTVFGRDSLLTSWMTMLVDPDVALGTLRTLADYQGRDVDTRTEEQPGRILHEMRFGESSPLALGGGHVYYGSIDATPLFVMLIGELARWGTRPAAVEALLPAADGALRWIDEFGDRDGDGYVEYERSSAHGLQNQGWKDSQDSIRFADGRLAEAPIALCEVQGYVYGALLAGADLAELAGDQERATALRARAEDLKTRFNRDFWVEDRGWLAMGLDRDKRQIDALASNMGHCLWTGILDRDKAEAVARGLLSAELFSGWGVRTLATGMTGYNPISYHNGSVWPHDNAIAAAGLMRYGFVDEAHRVMDGMVEVAGQFGRRLPELFGGFGRAELPFPVRYPTSCSPQAWAAATPLLFLRSMLRLEPDAVRSRVRLDPEVPERVGELVVKGVDVCDGKLSVEVDNGRCRVLEQPAGVTVTIGSGDTRSAVTRSG